LIAFNRDAIEICNFEVMNVERRLIQLFKSFVERVFLPQLKSTDRPALEWNKFGSMLSQENINY